MECSDAARRRVLAGDSRGQSLLLTLLEHLLSPAPETSGKAMNDFSLEVGAWRGVIGGRRRRRGSRRTRRRRRIGKAQRREHHDGRL
jgi:hypothetical protein